MAKKEDEWSLWRRSQHAARNGAINHKNLKQVKLAEVQNHTQIISIHVVRCTLGKLLQDYFEQIPKCFGCQSHHLPLHKISDILAFLTML